MEEKRNESRHSLIMRGRDFLSATGIEDVDCFDDDKVVAYTAEGQMTVKGAELKINRLSIEGGELELEGIIDSIEYQDSHKSAGGGLFSKIFK